MSNVPPSEVSRLLSEAAAGDRPAADQVFPLVYQELSRLARHVRRGRRPDETLATTALVHEAYLKLSGKTETSWEGKAHFFRIAARVMRDLLVDRARRQRAAKRGGDAPNVSLDAVDELPDVKDQEILPLHEALKRLENIDERQARVVELRYFVGLTNPETAEILGISKATVERDWVSARAWLRRELEE